MWNWVHNALNLEFSLAHAHKLHLMFPAAEWKDHTIDKPYFHNTILYEPPFLFLTVALAAVDAIGGLHSDDALLQYLCRMPIVANIISKHISADASVVSAWYRTTNYLGQSLDQAYDYRYVSNFYWSTNNLLSECWDTIIEKLQAG